MRKFIATIQKGFLIKATIVILAVFIILSLIVSEDNSSGIDYVRLEPLTGNWMIDGKDATLPAQVISHKNVMIQLQNRLPSQIMEDGVLCYRSNFCMSKVYIDGEERYSYGYNRPLPYGNMDRIMSEYNATHTIKVSAARGYAIEGLNNINESSMTEFVHRADEAMYQNKKKYKSRRD